MDYLKDIDEIWKNTPKYETLSGDVASIFGLYVGCFSSGYVIGEPCGLVDNPFLIFGKDKLNGIFNRILNESNKEKIAHSRIDEGYCGFKDIPKGLFGFLPSEVLSGKDLIHNKLLLELLIGECNDFFYYDKYLVGKYKINKNKARPSMIVNDNKLIITIGHDTPDEALKYGFSLASKLKCDGLSFKAPFLFVGDKKLCEVSVFDYNLFKLKSLENKLKLDLSEEAKQNICKAIDNYKTSPDFCYCFSWD